MSRMLPWFHRHHCAVTVPLSGRKVYWLIRSQFWVGPAWKPPTETTKLVFPPGAGCAASGAAGLAVAPPDVTVAPSNAIVHTMGAILRRIDRTIAMFVVLPPFEHKFGRGGQGRGVPRRSTGAHQGH